MLVLTTNQMKRAEQIAQKAGLSYMDMMQNAGIMAFNYCNKKFDILTKRTVILCGNGNNAGDGFIMARKIHECGGEVAVVLCCANPNTKESNEAFLALRPETVEVINLAINPDAAKDRFDEAEVFIDAVYGTGFRGELNSCLRNVFDYVNNSTAIKVALDMPSGVNSDTGQCDENFFVAEVTLAFAALKYAHFTENAKEYCGDIEVLDIGIPSSILYMVKNNAVLLTESIITTILPVRRQTTHKGNYGKLLNISGSKTMSGAAMMSTLAAMRMGAGVTMLATPSCVAPICASNLMEAMTFPLAQTTTGSISALALEDISVLLKKATTCLIGCGLSVNPETCQVVEYVINHAECSLVLDADALNCISDMSILKNCKAPIIITPHLGEMSKLTGQSIADINLNPFQIADMFSKEYNVIVVLKGHQTIITTPSGEMFENTTGNAGLAKGGSGDVLAGMISALVAQGMDAKKAAICGVYLHGLAADKLSEKMSQYAMLARDVIQEIPFVLKGLER